MKEKVKKFLDTIDIEPYFEEGKEIYLLMWDIMELIDNFTLFEEVTEEQFLNYLKERYKDKRKFYNIKKITYYYIGEKIGKEEVES